MTRKNERRRHAEADKASQDDDWKRTHLRNPTAMISMLLFALDPTAAWRGSVVGEVNCRTPMRFASHLHFCDFRSCHAPRSRHPLGLAARHMPPQMVVGVPSGSEVGKWLEKVQKEFWDEVELERVATLVELPVMFTDETSRRVFDIEKWEQHRGTGRYGRLLIGVLFGVTSRRIAITVALLTVFSGLVALYDQAAKTIEALPEVQLPLTPFELTAPVLGLLLVFRTNTAYERFDRGSDAAWEMTNQMRSMMSQLALYTSGPQTPKHEREASIELIDACCVLHGWLMIDYLRGDQTAGKTAELLKLTLGEGTQDMQQHHLLAEGLTPTAARAAFGVALMRRLPSLGECERIAVDAQLSGFLSSLSLCEKLLCTPIPLGYTRYSVRFLWIWLSLLPFALVNTFSTFGVGTWWEDKPKPVILLATLFIGFIFLSIEDIAAQIEEPFTILPLNTHQEWLLHEAKQIKLLMQLDASSTSLVPELGMSNTTLGH